MSRPLIVPDTTGATFQGTETPVVYCIDIIRNYATYAQSLAATLGVPLHVYAPSNLPISVVSDKIRILEEQARRLGEIFPGCKPVSQVEIHPGVIVVDHLSDGTRKPYAVVAPRYMSTYDPYNKKKIFVPLGDGPAGITAARHAVWLARHTNSALVFWHTTWPNKEVISSDPKDHMCRGARMSLLQAQMLAEEAKVPYEVDIRSISEAIADGIVAAAYEHDCNLIVMRHGASAVLGSHCDSVFERSPIPLLII